MRGGGREALRISVSILRKTVDIRSFTEEENMERGPGFGRWVVSLVLAIVNLRSL